MKPIASHQEPGLSSDAPILPDEVCVSLDIENSLFIVHDNKQAAVSGDSASSMGSIDVILEGTSEENQTIAQSLTEGLEQLALEVETCETSESCESKANFSADPDPLIVIFDHVSRMVRIKDWRLLGRELEIDDFAYVEARLDDIELQHRISLPGRVNKILLTWRERHGDRATVDRLIQVLEDLNFKYISDKIKRLREN